MRVQWEVPYREAKGLMVSVFELIVQSCAVSCLAAQYASGRGGSGDVVAWEAALLSGAVISVVAVVGGKDPLSE